MKNSIAVMLTAACILLGTSPCSASAANNNAASIDYSDSAVSQFDTASAYDADIAVPTAQKSAVPAESAQSESKKSNSYLPVIGFILTGLGTVGFGIAISDKPQDHK